LVDLLRLSLLSEPSISAAAPDAEGADVAGAWAAAADSGDIAGTEAALAAFAWLLPAQRALLLAKNAPQRPARGKGSRSTGSAVAPEASPLRRGLWELLAWPAWAGTATAFGGDALGALLAAGADGTDAEARRAVLAAVTAPVTDDELSLPLDVAVLVTHPEVLLTAPTARLLAACCRLAPPPRADFLRTSFAAYLLYSALPTALAADAAPAAGSRRGRRGSDASSEPSSSPPLGEVWAAAYVAATGALLDGFTALVAASDGQASYWGAPAAAARGAERRTAALLALVRMPWPATGTSHSSGGPAAALLASVHAAAGSGGLRKKLNKWVKTCLKFALHAPVVVDALCELFQAARARPGDDGTPWGALWAPSEEDFYHPATALQMVVGHSKFASVLRGGRQKHAGNTALLRLVVVLLSGAEPAAHVADHATLLVARSPEVVAPTDRFLVTQLARGYHGTMSESDRLTLRALHLLHAAGRGPPPFTLPAQGPALRKHDAGVHPVLAALSHGPVYATLVQWPQWRSSVPQPLRAEGSDAEGAYRQGWLAVTAAVRAAWGGGAARDDGAMDVDDDDEDNNNGDGDDGEGPHGGGDDDDDSVASAASEGSDSVKSLVDVDGADGAGAGLGDVDDAVPWVDEGWGEPRDGSSGGGRDNKDKDKDKEGSGARVYDPCYWLPAIHHALMQVTSVPFPHSQCAPHVR